MRHPRTKEEKERPVSVRNVQPQGNSPALGKTRPQVLVVYTGTL